VNRKIKIAAVSYLNTKPLLYGLLKSEIAGRIQLQLDVPAECARMLREGQAHLGLAPVAAIPELSQAHIVSDYCIGAEGAVRTVAIYAERPLEQVTRLYLDHHSRTSTALAEILLREYWKLDLALIPAEEGYIARIGGDTAGLVIGDRAIGLEERFAYTYDLGEAWTAHTGLPFVFAVWLSTQPLEPAFARAFNRALRAGVADIPQLMHLLPSPWPGFDLKEYFTRYISYSFDAPKREALRLFLSKMSAAKSDETDLFAKTERRRAMP
jgi:chorismate dehydratase